MDCIHTETIFKCIEYVRNYDADTIMVNIPGIPKVFGYHIGVRVAHVDTPEIKGTSQCEKDKAIAARDFVTTKLKTAHQINLINVKRDKYFRILADVEIDGKLLSKLLLENRYAIAYEGELKQQINWCAPR